MCAGKMTRDAAVLTLVALGFFSLMLTMERHFVEFAKKDSYNAYFQDLFGSSTRSGSLPAPEMGGVVREAWRHRHVEGEGADGRDGSHAVPL